MKKSEWELNAQLRYDQLCTSKDITFWNVFIPFWEERFKEWNNNRVVEIGCGPGVLTGIASKYIKEIIAIDMDYQMISIAREHNKDKKNISYACDKFENYVFDGKINSIYAHMVFHNIRLLDDVLLKANRCMDEGGELVFSIPHPCFYRFYKESELGESSYYDEKMFEIDFIISNDDEPLPMKISFYHRKLESYINTLVKSGFVVTGVIENTPDTESMDKYNIPWKYPRYMTIKAKKLADL